MKSDYKVITLQKSKHNVITKMISNYIVITFLYLPISVYALSFQSELIDGMLAYGTVEPGETAFVEESYLNIGKDSKNLAPIPITKDGQFALGIPQDATQLKLTVKQGEKTEELSFPVHQRKWDEEYVTGLPPQKVEPNQKDNARITAEAIEMRQARQVSDYSGFPKSWQNPVPAYKRISSHFGSRRILNNIKKQGHSGTDLAAPTGTPIYAPVNGRIVYLNPDVFLTGQTVMIDHGFGVFSSYSHMSATHVRLNQVVKAGDLIGEVGQTGRATGPHLHWTVTWFGIRVNPEDLILPSP